MLNDALRYVEGIVAYFISPPLHRAVNSLYTLHESIQACAVTATSNFIPLALELDIYSLAHRLCKM